METFYASITPAWWYNTSKKKFDDWAESVLTQVPKSWDHSLDYGLLTPGKSTLMLRSKDPGMHVHLRLILEDASFTTEKCTPRIWWHFDGDGEIAVHPSFPLAG